MATAISWPVQHLQMLASTCQDAMSERLCPTLAQVFQTHKRPAQTSMLNCTCMTPSFVTLTWSTEGAPVGTSSPVVFCARIRGSGAVLEFPEALSPIKKAFKDLFQVVSTVFGLFLVTCDQKCTFRPAGLFDRQTRVCLGCKEDDSVI